MKILGIVDHPGHGDVRVYEDIHQALVECLASAERYADENAEPAIQTSMTTVHNVDISAGALAAQVRAAHAVIIASHAINLSRPEAIARKLKEHEGDRLRGKWFGLIVFDDEYVPMVEESAFRILGRFNEVGMLLLPHAIAWVQTPGSGNHLRLGRHAAVALSTHVEWNGMDVWSTEAA